MDHNAAHDPEKLVAVVGMAGRFPGAADVDGLWSLLMDGRDAIGPVPPERWDASAPLDPEREIQAVGGFIDGVDRFDAGFFGVSPREARVLDPQQRLLMELTWRALEDAGQPAAALGGSRTGVYIGCSWHDYELMRIARGVRPTPHSLVGNALDVIAARLSYFFGLRGPSLTVETGCSSSLVALHLAGQALREGEIDAAVVGGANLMLDPHVTVGLTHFGGLSPDGRCAAFSASANGFVRGEGVAALYVKTLKRALEDGDRIHGVIVRTVVNNDGGGDSLVTPSGEGQEDLLTRAYLDGDIPYQALAYLEAHGTGTGRGDPIEAGAIGRVLGAGRDGGPLPIGSIKTNIGHLEACAGLAGLFKVLLALRHRTVPPSLHSAELNPRIPFEDINVRVVREPLELPDGGPLYMGVNSFGWGGTNAHVVVRSAPQACEAPADDSGRTPTGLPAIIPLSAKERPVLAKRARELGGFVASTPVGTGDLEAVLGPRRDHFAERAGIVAAGGGDLESALAALAAGPEAAAEHPAVATGQAVPRGRTAFVFPGQGSQWSGMGRALYTESPLFAATVQKCAEALRPHVAWDPLAVFTGESGDEWMTRIDMLQPTLWTMALGLAELWRGAGVQPDVVLGHSQGEITAATLAGVLSYEDAALVMVRRSAIARRTSGHGRMLAVDLDREAAQAALEGFEDSVSLAVHNGPSSCVLSGDEEAVLVLKEVLEADGVYCRLVNVDYASHSPQMDPLRDDLLSELAPAAPRRGSIELMSTVSCRRLDGPEMDAEYWAENLRRPVLFADAMNVLLDEGVTHVVEISPHPVLVPAVEQLAEGRPGRVAVLPTLRRDRGTAADFAMALAGSYAAGLEPFGGSGRPAPGLPAVPGYPLRGDRHWTEERPRGSGANRGFEAPLVPAPGDPGAWHAAMELSLVDLPWLADHRVYGTAVLPGAAMLSLMVNAARARRGSPPGVLEDVAFHEEVALTGDPRPVTVEWRDDLGEGGRIRLLALPDGAASWAVNATGRTGGRPDDQAAPRFPEWHEDVEPTPPGDFYERCEHRQLGYGPSFQTVQKLHVHAEAREALAELVLPDGLHASAKSHVLHPALWDGALQVSLTLSEEDAAVLPTSVERIVLFDGVLSDGAGGDGARVTTAWSHARRRADGRMDISVFGEGREPLMTVQGLALQPLPAARGADDDDRLHRVQWVETRSDEDAPPSGDVAGRRWVILGEPAGAAVELSRAAAALGVEVVHASADDIDAVLAPAAADGPGPVDAVVFMAPPREAGIEAQQSGLDRLTSVVRACAGHDLTPALAIVTALAQEGGGERETDPGSALYWGYTRVLRREHGELGARLIDVDPDDPGWAAACADELAREDGDDQVVLRAARRAVARLARGPADGEAEQWPVPGTRPQPFRVEYSGAPARLRCVPLERVPPGPGEVEIEIAACAPAAPSGDAGPAGLTGFAGRVAAVGPDVAGLEPGDRVAACAAGPPATHVTVRAEHLRGVPGDLADEEAAALPAAMTAAWHALADLAKLDPGETVLVHVQDGGAGPALVQVALALGGRVVATVESPGQRDQVVRLGVTDVLDRADRSWADRARALTGGAGVDVLVNHAGGPVLRLGLEVLADGGRFVDFARPQGDPGSIALDSLSTGAVFAVADLAGLARRRPARVAKLLGEVWELVEKGTLKPPATRRRTFAEFTADDGAAAGCAVQTVVSGPETVERVDAVPMPGGAFRPDGTYLITGGLGALGLSLGEYLAAHRAGALVLIGRSAPTAEAGARIAALRAGGTRVETLRCDVGDADALRRALDSVRDALPPLRGVAHAAGVLADATIANLTPDLLRLTLAPKVGGARNVEAVTAGDPLDFFVLFSSAAGLIGNPGQAAYAAANAYLDAFAVRRRRRGLPALSVQWGPFTEAGLAARDQRRGDRLEERGMSGIAPHEAWRALPRLLGGDEPVIGYVPVDLRRWFDSYPEIASLKSWERLYSAAARGGADGPAGGAFLARLLEAPADARAGLVEEKVRELSGRVLGADPERIGAETPFKSLGLDSLMSLELRNRLEAAFGLKLSPTLLWTYGNPAALAGALCERLTGPADPAATATASAQHARA
ncbi:SDR family NAD(P)-dependent oxidoreductase [Spirillospora sp. NPDC048832]